jgi:hypothetical protein
MKHTVVFTYGVETIKCPLFQRNAKPLLIEKIKKTGRKISDDRRALKDIKVILNYVTTHWYTVCKFV